MDILKDIASIFVFCFITYVAIIAIIRISGKRTLSKFNSFDFIVTVCLGSIMATTIVDSSLPIYKGIAGFGSLVFFQYIISSLTSRSKKFQKLVLFKPAILFYNGSFEEKTLKDERISKQEVYEAVRLSGYENMENVQVVILETEGSISVLPYSDADGESLAFKMRD